MTNNVTYQIRILPRQIKPMNFLTFQLLNEVVPIMISYALIGAISAVVQLASVASASAYVAQISRRRLREKQQSWVSRNQLESQV